MVLYEVTSSTYGSNQYGVVCGQHVVNSFPPDGFHYLQNNSEMWLRVFIYIAFEVRNFVLWLKLFVTLFCGFIIIFLLDCFSLFLYFLTSLVKFSFWNLKKAQEAKAFL